jgi:hypothetical protein
MFVIFLLAVFAAGAVSNAASITSMALKMATVEMDGGHMGDCQSCPPDDGTSLACDQACMVPLLAIAPADRTELAAVHADVVGASLQETEGYLQPPQTSPPRPLS